MTTVTLRFYAELNDRLPKNRKKVDFQVTFKDNRFIKDLIESLCIPHTEVGLILVNGKSVDFSYKVQDGDRLSIYPQFRSLNVNNEG